jgi:uncharacterized membrane protein
VITINPASAVWILLNGLGVLYGVRVSLKYRCAERDTRDYKGDDAAQIKFQARQNRIIAALATACAFVFLIAGVTSVLFRPGDPTEGLIVVCSLIIGDVLAVAIIYRLDTGWDKLRSIVGGRRKDD